MRRQQIIIMRHRHPVVYDNHYNGGHPNIYIWYVIRKHLLSSLSTKNLDPQLKAGLITLSREPHCQL